MCRAYSSHKKSCAKVRVRTIKKRMFCWYMGGKLFCFLPCVSNIVSSLFVDQAASGKYEGSDYWQHMTRMIHDKDDPGLLLPKFWGRT
jgi:hypothetical protein